MVHTEARLHYYLIDFCLVRSVGYLNCQASVKGEPKVVRETHAEGSELRGVGSASLVHGGAAGVVVELQPEREELKIGGSNILGQLR